MFRKRIVKGKIRKKGSDESEIVDNIEDEQNVEQSLLLELKDKQNLRIRKSGVSSTELLVKESSKEKVGNTIVLGSTQFLSHIDNGLESSGVAHEDILNQYINNNLQSKSSTELKVPVILQVSRDDALYKIPEEMKKITESVKSVIRKEDGESSGIASVWSTGLAEVALPITYKLKNIEQTERAAKLKIEEDKRQSELDQNDPTKSSAYYKRFQNNAFYEQAMNGHQDEMGKKRSLKSSDDYVLDKFKKFESSRRRR